MKILYQAADGKIFKTENECINHENNTNPMPFEKSKFYSSYGTEISDYKVTFATFYFISSDEWEKMRIYLRGQNRTISEKSNNGWYISKNMTLYPIDNEIKRLEEDKRNIIKKINEIKQMINKLEV